MSVIGTKGISLLLILFVSHSKLPLFLLTMQRYEEISVCANNFEIKARKKPYN